MQGRGEDGWGCSLGVPACAAHPQPEQGGIQVSAPQVGFIVIFKIQLVYNIILTILVLGVQYSNLTFLYLAM